MGYIEMAFSEKTILLHTFKQNYVNKTGLSIYFAIVCIIDVFGVFPIIALPKTIINCGAYGLLLVTVVCLMQIYTAILLGKSWLIACKIDSNITEKHRYPYSALVELTFGKNISRVATILLNLTIFGGGIPNLLVASQNLDLFTIRLFGNTIISYCWWIVIIGIILCPILWLGSPKDMKFLCALSVSIVLMVFTFVVTCLFQTNVPNGNAEVANERRYLWENIAIAYGVLTFQFDIHPTILAIQVDMTKKSKVDVAIIYGFAASLAMFVITYMLAYIKLGINIKASLLESVEASTLLHLTALLVAFQLCLSSAVSNSALYQNLEDYAGISKDFSFKRCMLRSLLTLSAIILAELVPKFDLVMSLLGGTLTGPLVFIFPPLIYIKLLRKHMQQDRSMQLEIIQHPAAVAKGYDAIYNTDIYKSNIALDSFTQVEIIICSFIVFIGSFGILATTYVNIVNNLTYVTLTQPCIYNTSFLIL